MLTVFLTVHCIMKLTVKPVVAHGVKARLIESVGKIFLTCIVQIV